MQLTHLGDLLQADLAVPALCLALGVVAVGHDADAEADADADADADANGLPAACCTMPLWVAWAAWVCNPKRGVKLLS